MGWPSFVAMAAYWLSVCKLRHCHHSAIYLTLSLPWCERRMNFCYLFFMALKFMAWFMQHCVSVWECLFPLCYCKLLLAIFRHWITVTPNHVVKAPEAMMNPNHDFLWNICNWASMAQIPLGSTRLDSTHSTCRAHAFWLCRASRTAQLDSLDTTSSTGSTRRARQALLAT